MSPTIGQRLWSRDNRWDGYSEDGTWYVTDAQRAETEARLVPVRWRAQVCAAVGSADPETLNKIAALLGVPEVVAWTPETP